MESIKSHSEEISQFKNSSIEVCLTQLVKENIRHCTNPKRHDILPTLVLKQNLPNISRYNINQDFINPIHKTIPKKDPY